MKDVFSHCALSCFPAPVHGSASRCACCHRTTPHVAAVVHRALQIAPHDPRQSSLPMRKSSVNYRCYYGIYDDLMHAQRPTVRKRGCRITPASGGINMPCEELKDE